MYKLVVILWSGTVRKTTFGGYGSEAYADKGFRDATENPHALTVILFHGPGLSACSVRSHWTNEARLRAEDAE